MNTKLINDNACCLFASFCKSDSERVLPILEELKNRGYSLCFDVLKSSDPTSLENTANEILSCDGLLSFVSPSSVNSYDCFRETNYSLMKNKKLIAVFLDEFTLSAGTEMQIAGHPHINKYEYSDFSLFMSALEDILSLYGFEKSKPAEKTSFEESENAQAVESECVSDENIKEDNAQDFSALPEQQEKPMSEVSLETQKEIAEIQKEEVCENNSETVSHSVENFTETVETVIENTQQAVSQNDNAYCENVSENTFETKSATEEKTYSKMCPVCNVPVPSDYKFCIKCGSVPVDVAKPLEEKNAKAESNIQSENFCPVCASVVADGYKFCPKCGSPTIKREVNAISPEKQEEVKKTCPHCNAVVPKEYKFCQNCGKKMPEITMADIASFGNLVKAASAERKKNISKVFVGENLSCPKCSTKISHDSKFCSVCGYKL